MRIFSKRSFQFDHPAGQEPAVVIQSQNFADVPGWVAASAMFKLASKTGDVTVIENKHDEKAAETGAKSKSAAEKKAEEQAQKEAAAAKAAAEADQSQ
ncbi:hypothetical protein [Brevibacillus centrosporus]|uniref:hypothetical protein n=1 Tax=Brevibacillus centrosporus TaxID=54910 RepID=UPI003B026F88